MGDRNDRNDKENGKSTDEKMLDTGLITDKNFQRDLIKASGITYAAGKQISIFITEEHGYGGGEYAIKSVMHNNADISVGLEFVADPFGVGTAATNHRLLFFVTDKPCQVSDVNIVDN